jgi:peptidoglycan biosynthesis protein MviN/MurJ (putative lipid II flippase)
MATVALIALRRPIVQLALQHGEFSSHDADVTSSLLAVYALGLLPNGLSWLLFRSLQSRERYWEAVRIAALSAGVYAGCAAALFHLWGLIGIAAAFPVSQTAACVLLYATHPRLLRAGAADILRFARPLALVSVTVAAVLVALTAGASLLPIGGTLRDVADLLGGGVIIVAGLSFGMPLLQVPEGRWIRASLVGRAGRPARRSALSGD